MASGDVERSVYFHGGDVVWASSTAPGDRLGEFLVRRGKLTREQLQIVVRDDDKRIGTACVDRGFLAAHELWVMVQAQLTEIFDRLLGVERGTWRFSAASIEGLAESQIHLSTQGLLVDALRRLDEMKIFRQVVRSAETLVQRPKNPPALSVVSARLQPDLGEEAQRFLAAFSGSGTIHELMRMFGKGEFDVTRMVYHLQRAGAVEVSQGPERSATSRRAQPVLTEREASDVIGVYSMALREIYDEMKTIRRADDLLRAAFEFLRDPESAHAEIFAGVAVLRDGTLDENLLIATSQEHGRGSEALNAALSELLFFALFQATEFLGVRRADDLARRVKVIHGMLSVPPDADEPL